MMNDIATTGGASTAIASLQNLKSGLQNVKDNLKVTGGSPFLRFDKGDWIYGPDNMEVQEGSRWAINPFSLQHGWACWTRYPESERKKNELLGEVMRPMTAPKPAPETLPTFAFGWVDQVSFDLVCLNGDDKDTQVHYKTTSIGGMSAVSDLISALMKQLDIDPSKATPVVDLQGSKYAHKIHGTVHTPIFAIMSWIATPTPGGDAKVPDAPADDKKPEPAAATPAAAPARQRRNARPAAATPEVNNKPAGETTTEKSPVAQEMDAKVAQMKAIGMTEAQIAMVLGIPARPTKQAEAEQQANEPAQSDQPAPARRRRAVA